MNKEIRIGTYDREIECTLWNNLDSNRVLIVAPAMGVSRRFYKSFSEYFVDLNYSVLTIDYFGMEHQSGKKYVGPIRLCDWGYVDLKATIEYAYEHFPNQDLFLIGHSIGGQVLPLASNKNKLKAVFLVASQNLSRYNWNGLNRIGVNIFWNLVIPLWVGVLGYLPGFAYGGRYNLHKAIARDWRHWGTSRNGLLGAIPAAKTDYDSITVPTKFVSIEGDNLLAPRKAVEELAKSYGSPVNHHEHLWVADHGLGVIGHFGFFRTRNSALWPMVDKWFGQHSTK